MMEKMRKYYVLREGAKEPKRQEHVATLPFLCFKDMKAY